MNKHSLTYFIPCCLSLTFMCGCINYTNTETQGVTHIQVIDKQQEKKLVSGYTDYRKSTKNVSLENKVTPSIDAPTRVKEKEYPTISYFGYEVMYDPKCKIPKCVEYELISSEIDGPYSRKGKSFRQDLSVNYPQADDDDYKYSGWSRGHMAPSGDFKWDNDAMWDTFYYTNCCPQDPTLNSGQWNSLEQKVRNWAKRFGRIIVVTGPIIGENKYGTLGYNKITIPDAFYKAILAEENAIAFVMYNQPKNRNMQKCAVSIDSLEELLGLDFFSELDDILEERIEATYDLKYWGL